MDGEGFFHTGDRLIVFAKEDESSAESIQALGDKRVARAQQLRPDRYRLFGEFSAFGVLIGIPAQQREVVRALGIIECVFADLRLANLKRLPQRGLAGLQVARRVLKEAETIQ